MAKLAITRKEYEQLDDPMYEAESLLLEIRDLEETTPNVQKNVDELKAILLYYLDLDEKKGIDKRWNEVFDSSKDINDIMDELELI